MSAPPGNRCEVLTPPGAGAIGIVRVSGPRAAEIVQAVFRSPRRHGSDEWGDRLRFGSFMDGEEIIDNVLVSQVGALDGPTFDISAHGGVRVIERVLQTLERLGASLTVGQEPADVWPVANQLEREALEALSRAKTHRAVRFLAWQRRHVAAHLQDIAAECLADLEAARRRLEMLCANYATARTLVEGASVVLVGPPNSGKSTLFNRLVGRAAAVVSTRSGTTRDWVSEDVEMAGVPVTLVDTAGFGVTLDELERLGIERGFTRAGEADLGLLVVDGSRPVFPGSDKHPSIHASLPPCLPVLNKLDAGIMLDAEHLKRLQGEQLAPVVECSARTGAGVGGLVERILEFLGFAQWVDKNPCLWSHRQVDLARQALALLPTCPDSAAELITGQLICESAA